MKVYTVHHRHEALGSLTGLVEDAILVKDGFSWPAFLVPLLWLLYKRMWIVLAFYLAAEMGLAALAYSELLPEAAATVGTFAVSLILGLEGNDLYRWSLDRRRYREQALVVARDFAAAEHRYFTSAAEAIGRGRAMAGSFAGPAE